jgi:hypothetical protein
MICKMPRNHASEQKRASSHIRTKYEANGKAGKWSLARCGTVAGNP